MKKFTITAFAVIGVIVTGALIWLATIDGSFHVKKSISIQSPVDELFSEVVNFNDWVIWSPWLCMEPDADVTITNEGNAKGDIYSWNGEMVGAGEIEHLEIVANKSIEQQIRFTKPFESQSRVYWEFEVENDSTTKVSWGMEGEMPFLFRFMAEKMAPWIGMDYERGLKMLKDHIEKGFIASEISIEGISSFEGTHFVAKKVTCPMYEVGESMKKTFVELNELCTRDSIKQDKALSIYHDFDFTSPDCTYSTGVPVGKKYKPSNPSFYVDKIPKTKTVKVIFTGDYEHLGNAWSAGFMYIQHKELDVNEDIAPFEVYLTDPNKEPNPTKWVTEVYFPIN